MRLQNGEKWFGGTLVLAVTAAAGVFVGCNHDTASPAPPPLIQDTATNILAAADWTSAVANPIVVRLTDFALVPADITLAAGVPVVLRITAPDGNAAKHYYSFVDSAGKDPRPLWVGGFQKAVAWRKVQTLDAEYKAPYFNAVELLVPTGTDLYIDLYFIPVEPGTYYVTCTEGTHAATYDMYGTITITGDAANFVDQEISPAWNPGLEVDTRTSGGNAVWTKPAASTTGTTDAAGTATALAADWNAGADSGDPRLAGITASVSVDKVILTADVAGVPFSVAPSVDSVGSGTIGAFTTTTPAVHADDGGPTAQISEVQITGYDVTTTYTLAVDATVIDMIELGGTGLYRFMEEDITLTNGLGYILRITNLDSTNTSKHYYTAPQFYETCVTRKAQDSQAEIKAPYFKAVELIIGGTTELYLVPTVDSPSGIPYDVICTVLTHEADGMVGTIKVVP